jgi:hypothetical protein
MSSTPAVLPPPGARLRETIEAILAEHPLDAKSVGGNFLIHLPDVATWTVVTSGARAGIHEGATQDLICFALCCKEDLLGRIFAGEPGVDLEAAIASNQIMVEGDLERFLRFMALLEAESRKGNMVTFRSRNKLTKK